MHSPRLAASLASAVLVTAFSTTALAGEPMAPDSESFEDRDARPAAYRTTNSGSAHRGESMWAPTEPILPEPPAKVWYGGQILLVDGASILLAYPTHGFSLVGVAVGGPIIHLANGHPWRAVGSLALRGGLTTLGFAVGAGLACHGPDAGDLCSLGGFFFGAPVGLAVAILLDSAVLAWEDAPAAMPAPTGLRVAPSLAMVEGGGTLGLLGSF